MKLIIYTDGASRGNPGHAAYGFSIRNDQGKVLHQEGQYIGLATNNFAEYSAVLNALKYINKKLKKDTHEINFFMDSKLVVEQLSGRYKIKSPTLKPLIHRIKEIESNLGLITYNHIPRKLNQDADYLANRALDEKP